ncbi:MAG: FGGY-family carbohydrate kinase [Sulfuriferula sp.]|nr:FGGY-family carbohydrate kinase [Sulfuriferula sp.]
MYYLGLDFGTSGARAVIIDNTTTTLWAQHTHYTQFDNPISWRDALFWLINAIPPALRSGLSAIAIDGTSGTVLLADDAFQPASPVLMYNHHLAGQPLAKLDWLTQHALAPRYLMHQVDYLNAQLTGTAGVTDYHNALKSGYDVRQMEWPATLAPYAVLLPNVVTPGVLLGKLQRRIARHYNLSPNCRIHAGTTDSIAAFIATGVNQTGVGVTSLGSTLVLKLLSQQYINVAEYGIYSHKYGDLWLVGGASNSGGAVLRQYFTDDELRDLSTQIDLAHASPYHYYPLPCAGERFPIADTHYSPRMEPRPEHDVDFLYGLLTGIARIEQQGYAKLVALGADTVTQVVTAGGGSHNPTWQAIRHQQMQISTASAIHTDAAFGSALLAKRGNLIVT